MVKDLWALRLQLLKDKVDATPNEETIFSSQLPAYESEVEDPDDRMHKQVLDKAMPSLIDSLGLCYLGMVLLRLPVSLGDLHRWAVREDVPFIRAIRFVPAIIKEKLPSEFLLVLDTTSALEPDQLGKAVHNLGLFYRHHFAISLPPLNAPLLLFKHIKDLALPASLLPMVQDTAGLLAIDFTFPKSGRRLLISSSPETSLIGLLVVATKFHHPFDSLRRSVTSLNDLAVLQINWSKWTQAQANHQLRIHAGSHLVRGSEMHVSEKDAMQFSDEQVDDYLDWYERTWIDEDRARHKFRPLDEDFRKWFPTGRQDGSLPAQYDFGKQSRKEQESAQQLLEDVTQALVLRDVVSAKEEQNSSTEVKRMGSSYRRYRSTEELTEDALAFHEAAANAVGMKLETLLQAVLQIEQRLINWRTSQRKAAKARQKGNSDWDASDEAGETEITGIEETHGDSSSSSNP